MKIIVTGATGFIGRNIAESFSAEGMEIIATGRSEAAGEALAAAGIKFIPADITRQSELETVFEPADLVIHCAAKTGDWGSYAEFYKANVEGTRNVIRLCDKNGIKKILFISTPSIYYTNKDRFDVREDEPLPEKQLTHYAATKLLAEKELEAWQEKEKDIIIFRPKAVYGPYENIFIPHILRMAEGKNIPLINGGKAMVDITWVDNLIDAVRSSLTAGASAWNRAYNISNGEPLSVAEWFRQMVTIFEKPFNPRAVPERAAFAMAGFMSLAGRITGKRPKISRFSVMYMVRSMTMSIERAKELLDYKPAVSNIEGFKRYAEWRRSQSRK